MESRVLGEEINQSPGIPGAPRFRQSGPIKSRGYMNPFLSPRGKNGYPILVINSKSWKSHFLSGEKKTGAAWRPWPGLAQAGLSGGKKTGAPNRAKSGIRAGPRSPYRNRKIPRKPMENKAFWEMWRSWSPQKSPETFKTLGKTMNSGQK